MFTRLKCLNKFSNIIFWLFLISIIAFVAYITIYKINIHFDLDSYDEGVYWQTLIAMQHNFKLYNQIFYSQPPIFIWLIYPFYILLGKTIMAARLAVAFYSLIGIISAFFIGKTLLNKWLGLILMVLLAFNFLYIKESKILQAEMPMLALALASYCLALYYQNSKKVKNSVYYIALSLFFLIIAIFTKLLAVALILPIAIIIINKLVKIHHISVKMFKSELMVVIKALLFSFLLIVIILLPYAHYLPNLYNQVIQFHLVAKKIFMTKNQVNYLIIASFVLNNIYLFILALLGIILGIFKKNKYLLPVFIWFISLLALLVSQKPLFYHHTTVLLAPMVILAILPFSLGRDNLGKAVNVIGFILVGLIVISNTQQILHYETNLASDNQNRINTNNKLAKDLDYYTKPEDFIVTDNQFVAGLAKRQVLPNLVDTSNVRVKSGFLTSHQLNNNLLNPKVTAALFTGNKLNRIIDQKTENILAQNFNLIKSYPGNIQFWYKKVQI